MVFGMGLLLIAISFVLWVASAHKKVPAPKLGQAIFVLLNHDTPFGKGEKIVVVDKIDDGKSYIVRRIQNFK